MRAVVLALALAVTPSASQDQLVLFEMDSNGASYLLVGADYTVVFDTGVGTEWRLVDDLQTRGVTSVDLLVLTHPHSDHISQAVDLVNSLPVGEVWVGAIESDTVWEQALMDELLETVQVTVVSSGHEARVGSLRLEVVWPDAPLRQQAKSHDSVNHDSLVVVAEVAGRRVLLPGDAIYDAEAGYASRVGAVDVLLLAHHGHADATSGLLLDAVTPELAAYSHRFANGWTLTKLQDRGIPVWGTHDGAITIDLGTLTVSQAPIRYSHRLQVDWWGIVVPLGGMFAAGGVGWLLRGFRVRSRSVQPAPPGFG